MPVPRLPRKVGTVVTFTDTAPIRSPSNEKPREYYIHAVVPGRYEDYFCTSDRNWWNEIDRLLFELGTLYYVKVIYNGKRRSTVLSNKNVSLPGMLPK